MTGSRITAVLVLLAAGLAATTAARADVLGNAGNATNGAALFATHCAECHSVREGKDKKGPSLFNVLDHKSGQREGFVYSDGLRGGAVTWTAEQVSAYLADPRKVAPSGKMKYDGLPDAAARADIVAYLAASGKKP